MVRRVLAEVCTVPMLLVSDFIANLLAKLFVGHYDGQHLAKYI